MAGLILVTPRSLTGKPHPDVERMRAHGFEIVNAKAGATPSEDELMALVPECVGWLAGVETVTPRVIEAATRLRAISRNGVGIDNLPMDVLRQRGIRILTADGANAQGVAELALGLLFSALRSIPQTDAGIKQGNWPRLRGLELRGRLVGVIGCGAIGREVARMVAVLGARVLAHDPRHPDLGLPGEMFSYADPDAILRKADIVTLHCPPPADGAPLLGQAQLAAMRRGAIVLNTARARLVDDNAMIAALDAGQIACYATDVFDAEPPSTLALAGHSRVIATSHIGGFTAESVDRATRIAADNLLVALGGSGGAT